MPTRCAGRTQGVVHLRAPPAQALWGALTEAKTQPFARALGRPRVALRPQRSLERRPILLPEPLFEPGGATDSEFIFCDLLNRMAARRWRSLGEASPGARRLAPGPEHARHARVVLIDGLDILAWADRERSGLTAGSSARRTGPSPSGTCRSVSSSAATGRGTARASSSPAHAGGRRRRAGRGVDAGSGGKPGSCARRAATEGAIIRLSMAGPCRGGSGKLNRPPRERSGAGRGPPHRLPLRRAGGARRRLPPRPDARRKQSRLCTRSRCR